jgi:hypothetical protein
MFDKVRQIIAKDDIKSCGALQLLYGTLLSVPETETAEDCPQKDGKASPVTLRLKM